MNGSLSDKKIEKKEWKIHSLISLQPYKSILDYVSDYVSDSGSTPVSVAVDADGSE